MATDRQDALKIHRRAVRRDILLPFVGGLLLIIVLVVFAAVEGRASTSAVANTMVTVLVLCPLALCLLPLYLLLAVAVVGMNRAHNSIARPLRRVEILSLTLYERTISVSYRLARASINLNARFAPLDKLLFSAFDRPAQEEDDHEQQ